MFKEGRNVLSSLNLVPDVGRDAVSWAMDELNKRNRTQADILFELNDRLAAVGVDPISKSAFNRVAVRAYNRRLRNEEHASVMAITYESLDAQKIERTDITVAEMIKIMAAEIMDANEGKISPEGLAFIAKAFRDVKTGEKLSSEMTEARNKIFEKTVDAATKAVGRARGLSAETIEQLKAEMLGVNKTSST